MYNIQVQNRISHLSLQDSAFLFVRALDDGRSGLSEEVMTYLTTAGVVVKAYSQFLDKSGYFHYVFGRVNPDNRNKTGVFCPVFNRMPMFLANVDEYTDLRSPGVHHIYKISRHLLVFI